MSPPSTLDRFKRHATPLVVSVVVVAVVLIVPPVVLGETTARTYALTAGLLILAVRAVLPYAVLVALGTLPLHYAGIASFAAPQTAADGTHSFSPVTALRHVAAGISYVLGAAAVGAIGIGAQLWVWGDSSTLPANLLPLPLSLGGMIIAGIFVSLQLWRYDTPVGALPRRTVLGTMALGGLLALSPGVASWLPLS